jgi:hypothetical protein
MKMSVFGQSSRVSSSSGLFRLLLRITIQNRISVKSENALTDLGDNQVRAICLRIQISIKNARKSKILQNEYSSARKTISATDTWRMAIPRLRTILILIRMGYRKT